MSVLSYLFLIHCKRSTAMTISPHSHVRQILHPAQVPGVAVHLRTGLHAAVKAINIIIKTTRKQNRIAIRNRTGVTENIT